MNGSTMTELPADVRSLFTGANYASLTTVLPDSSPAQHTVPLRVGVEGERLAVMTSPRSRKARNVDTADRAARPVTVEQWAAGTARHLSPHPTTTMSTSASSAPVRQRSHSFRIRGSGRHCERGNGRHRLGESVAWSGRRDVGDRSRSLLGWFLRAAPDEPGTVQVHQILRRDRGRYDAGEVIGGCEHRAVLAVPHLTADLAPSGIQQLWIVDIYGFLIAGFLVTMGTIGDRIGRKKLLLISAAVFGIASVAAAFSTSPEMLIASRALLGVAGAAVTPSVLALVTGRNPEAVSDRG